MEKILPYDVWREANFHLQMDKVAYIVIGEKLGAEPIIAALLDNLRMMFACGDIVVEDKTTQAIREFVYIAPAEEPRLEGYTTDVVYRIKPEFAECFEVSEKEISEMKIKLEKLEKELYHVPRTLSADIKAVMDAAKDDLEN